MPIILNERDRDVAAGKIVATLAGLEPADMLDVVALAFRRIAPATGEARWLLAAGAAVAEERDRLICGEEP